MIVCLVANPSIDKLFEVERLVRGDIHRPVGFEQTAGGKGLNVARAVSALGGDVRAVALFRGHSGKWLEETLSSEGVHGSFVWTHGENRSSLSVADRETGGLTEFYEHGSEVPSSAWPELANATAALFGETTWLTISGSVPVGIDDSAYRDLVGEARAVGVRVALDAEGDRLRLALEGQPDVVKVNASEASELLDDRNRPPLAALVAYCHFGVIYQRSPVGLPLPAVLGKMGNADLNRLLQELAWDAVKSHPLSGVK